MMNNKEQSIIIAGYGGQGILLLGRLIAYTAMFKGLNVTWFPAYGAEMRGGTANCTVVMSHSRIGSPVVTSPDMLIAMNCPSLERFLPRLKERGTLIYDSSMVSPEKCGIEDFKKRLNGISAYSVPATEEASRLGSTRYANMFLLGAFLSMVFPDIEPALLDATFKKALSRRHHHTIETNLKAVHQGASLIRQL